VTNQERERIHQAARRYVHDQGPNPPTALLEQVARIVLQAKTLPPSYEPNGNLSDPDDRKQRDGKTYRVGTHYSS
jgi:hypothetical protein